MNLYRTMLVGAMLVLVAHGVTRAEYEAPELISIDSPSAGTVEITMQVDGEEGFRGGIYHIYRRNGNHDTPVNFDVIERNGYPHRFMDTAGTPEIYANADNLVLRVEGLKSGTFSFYVTRTNGSLGSYLVESDPSNVLSVHVNGNNDEDGNIGGVVRPLSIAGVNDAVVAERFSAYPNPATNVIMISAPRDGEGIVRVYDALGAQVMNITINVSTEVYTLDVSGLPAGAYHAEILQGEGISRSRFNVVR